MWWHKFQAEEQRLGQQTIENTLPVLEFHATEPILGYKAAYLCLDVRTGESYFSAKQFMGRYNIDSRAVCGMGENHDSVELSCPCGFYMFKEKSDAVKAFQTYKVNALLHVEAYGDIIEHQLGYRASEQVVLKVSLTKTCWRCSNLATRLVVRKTWKQLGLHLLRPICGTCVRSSESAYTLGEVCSLLKTDVSFDL